MTDLFVGGIHRNGIFPSQRASHVDSVFMSWRHYELFDIWRDTHAELSAGITARQRNPIYINMNK